MEEEYKMDMQDPSIGEANGIDGSENLGDPKDYGDIGGFDEGFEEDDGSGFRNNRGRGNFRNSRGRPPHAWMNGPPRFRGRGYGPQGPPMRGRGFFRGRGTPRYSNAPNFDGNWGPMGPPPPGMMGGPPPFGPPPGMMPGGPMGPPPNMMGQPPPFGGPPPGAGVPNMPNPELWVETKSEDGKSYFYHARTRETTWTRPQEGPGINCKVVSQAEIEAMAVNGSIGGMMQGGPQQQMPMGMGMPNGGPMMQPGQAPPFMNQPPHWMKEAPNQQPGQDDNPPSENDDMPPGESAPLQQSPMNQPPPTSNPMNFMTPGGPNFSQAPPNFNSGPPGGPPGGFPPGWGGWGGWPPPLVAQPPPNLANAAVPDAGAAVQQPPPQMGMKPPGMQGGLPGVPGSMQGVPVGMPGVPGGMSGPPGGMSGPPGGMSGPPGGMSGPPGGMSGPPGGMSGPPGSMSGPPGGMSGPPGSMSGPPGSMSGPPGGMSGPPGSMSGPPGGMSGPPGGMSGPPGGMSGPPGGMSGPPGGMSGPPGGMSGPPGGMSGPPGSMSGPPGGMSGPPGSMSGPPGGMSGPPGGMSGPPGSMSGPPGGMPGGPGGPGGMSGGPGGPGGRHGGLGGMPGAPGSGIPGQGKILPEIIPLTDSPPPTKKEELKIPPEIVAAAAAWTTHRSPDGRPYYYHAANQQSVWEKPKALQDLQVYQNKITAEKLLEKRKYDPNSSDDVIDVDAHAEAQAAAEAVTQAAIEAEKKSVAEKALAEKQRIEKEKAEKERLEKEKAEKEKLEKEKAKADKSRPVSSTPISGTPWCVVWTGDGRVFFYNPTAHTSVWERPAQLAGRADVDKAVSQPPHALLDQKKEGATQSKSSTVNGESKRKDSGTDESDGEPGRKRPKQEEKKQPAQIDLGKEAAIEAEVRAARERGVVPHEQRLKSFLQMLHEKQVSAFSTWEKELHKIVFDPRYLMLNSKERRQVFDQYVRERAEEERKEKKNRLQQKKQVFRTLMEEAKLHSKSSFTEFSSKHGRDERFKSIEKSRDREIYFNEFITELRKKEKDDKEKKREQVKADYLALLKEKGVDRHTRFQEVKKKMDSDPRYKAVESGAAREDYFREYCKQLKDDRRKDKDTKERDRSVKKEKKEKERDKEKDGKEGKEKKKKEKGEKKEEPPAEEMEAEETEAEPDAAAREKEARAQASIKEREREVQRALATSLRDRDKEREQHKRDEAVQHFNALLADLVRNPELAWREAKKQLKKDHRYNLAELLNKEDKERLFSSHTHLLASKRRDKLRAILTDLNVGCTSHWKEVREQLKNEPTTPVYSSTAQMEREFRDFQRDKQTLAKTQLRQLLQETRSITHRSLAAVKENSANLHTVHDALKNDARYLALDHIPDERQAIITSYLEELEKKGPPPPPTATEPSRRPKP